MKYPFPIHKDYEFMHALLIIEILCASTTFLARGPTYKPIPLVVLLHRLPRLSSELLTRTQTAYPPFLLWTPSLTAFSSWAWDELPHSLITTRVPSVN